MCKSCKNIYTQANKGKQYFRYLKNTYDLSEEEYNTKLKEQKYKCAICKTNENTHSVNNRFYVDHCHLTNKVRGLLCHNCNIALGGFKDSVVNMKNAILYLKKYSNN